MIDNPEIVESPKTLTLPHEEEDAEQIQDEEEAQSKEPGTPASPVADLQVNSPVSASRPRGGPKRKKKGVKRRGNEKIFRKKLEDLNESLKPISFIPVDLQFSSHEKLLKKLGLWDFVHMDFDANLRKDLIAQLIANYRDRCSYVNDSRINVSRADLARALKLPVKKEKDSVLEEEEAKESICFIEEFLSKWVLLHGEDDMWMMPPEVSNWTKAIKEGHFDKLDWASLIWFMVDKELKSAPNLGNCYYASHLQSLIKCQKEELLMEEEPEIEVAEIEDLKMEADEKDAAGTCHVSMANGVVESHGDHLELEEQNIELSLGGQEEVKDSDVMENNDVVGKDDVMDCEENNDVVGKDGVMDCEENNELEPHSCLSNRKGGESDSEHILQRCNLGHVGDADFEDDGKKELGQELEDGEEEEEVEEAENNELEPHSCLSNRKGGESDSEHILQRCNLGHVGDADFEDDGKKELGEELEDGEEEVEEAENNELEPHSCLSNRKGESDSEHILQRCNLGHVGDADFEDDGKKELGQELEDGEEEEEVEEAHNGGYPLPLKGETLDAIASTNLLEGMEAAQLPYSTGLQNLNNSSRGFLVSCIDTQSIPVGSSFLGNINHRGVGHESGTSHHSLNGNNKRMRSDDQWQEKLCFYECMQDMQQCMGKAKMLYAEKEQAHSELYMNQQLLLEDSQNKQRLIDELHKARCEEQNRRQMEVYRLERELYMMGNLLDGYRKALKKSHQDFAEYRARCPQPEQSLYKDVKGSRGLVLSAAELEKQRLKQEEEQEMNMFMLERKLEDFEAGWYRTFEAHEQTVLALSDRLNGVGRDVKQLKEFGNC